MHYEYKEKHEFPLNFHVNTFLSTQNTLEENSKLEQSKENEENKLSSERWFSESNFGSGNIATFIK